jgi:hypothetical protein
MGKMHWKEKSIGVPVESLPFSAGRGFGGTNPLSSRLCSFQRTQFPSRSFPFHPQLLDLSTQIGTFLLIDIGALGT